MEPEKFESYLTAEELTQFKKNYKETDYDMSYEAYVVRQKLTDVITGGFDWSGSPQGHQYWSDVQARLTMHAQLPKGVDYMQYFTAIQWKALTELVMENLGVELYEKWMNDSYANIESFIYKGLPTKHQANFMFNIRMADTLYYRASRGYKVKHGQFLTKESKIAEEFHEMLRPL
jgi:hypothetical protein